MQTTTHHPVDGLNETEAAYPGPSEEQQWRCGRKHLFFRSVLAFFVVTFLVT